VWSGEITCSTKSMRVNPQRRVNAIVVAGE
jgi:hypothetical protein